MSQALHFWKDCWIYTKKTERQNLRVIVKALQDYRSMTLSNLQKLEGATSRSAMRNALYYLVMARVVRVRQFKENRVYTLNDGWVKKLKYMMDDPRPRKFNNKSDTSI